MTINPKIDRSNWPCGEWDDEPDFLEWVDEETGLQCEIKRHRDGHLCGYVFAYHKDTDDDLKVHGTVTFYQEKFGFACAQACDLVPASSSWWPEEESYKNIEFVKNECRKLALQISQKIGSGKYWKQDASSLKQNREFEKSYDLAEGEE